MMFIFSDDGRSAVNKDSVTSFSICEDFKGPEGVVLLYIQANTLTQAFNIKQVGFFYHHDSSECKTGEYKSASKELKEYIEFLEKEGRRYVIGVK